MKATESRKAWVRWAVGGFWALGIAFIAWLAWREHEVILPFLAQAEPPGLLKAWGWFLASLAAIVLGWVALMRHFSPGLPWWTHVWIYSVTLATRRLPGTLWYVGGRMVLYKREGVSRARVSIASSVEYAVIIVSGAFVGLVLLPTSADYPPGAAASLVVTLLLVLAGPRLLAWFSRRVGRPLPVPVRVPDVLVWLAALCLMWLAGGMMLVEIIRAFRTLAVDQVAFVLGAWAISGALGALTFFLPSSFGVSEISLAFFLAQQMPPAEAGTIAIVTRLLGMAFEFLLAAAFLPFLRKQARNTNSDY